VARSNGGMPETNTKPFALTAAESGTLAFSIISEIGDTRTVSFIAIFDSPSSGSGHHASLAHRRSFRARVAELREDLVGVLPERWRVPSQGGIDLRERERHADHRNVAELRMLHSTHQRARQRLRVGEHLID